jgi:uncharacterized Tic20 family protein
MTEPPAPPPPPQTPPPQTPPPASPYGGGAPQPQYWSPGPLSPQDERTWAMFAHIGALIASVVAMAFLGPLIVLLVQGPKSPFVRRHAVESLNFQITLLIALAVGIALSVLTLGIGLIVVIPAALAIGIAALVFMVLASIAANNGEDYRYPLNIRLVK